MIIVTAFSMLRTLMLRALVWAGVMGGMAAGLGAAETSPWPVVDSDLAPHPKLTQGVLPNGVRYLILPNAEPKGRVSARLVVAAGSLHEQDDEQGLAHFVEHLAFRGTRSHPGDSLTAVLQRLGVGRGPDNTAFTFYDHTSYHLELPDDTEGTLRDGLKVFREYAEEVAFDGKLIELERGVVLAEKTTRDTPVARNALVNLEFLWPTARQLRRQPIGQAEAIKRFTRKQCVAFYDAWYRPERLAVVLVGTIEPAMAVRLVEEVFASMKARAPARPEPADLIPATARKPSVEVYAEPGFFGVSLMFEHPLATPRVRDSKEERARLLRRGMAMAMFNSRLSKLAIDPATSFVSPQVTQNTAIPGWTVISLGASGRIDDWKQVFADVEKEHRRAYLHGFSEAELTEAKEGARASAEQGMRTEATWSSVWLAGRLSECLVAGTVFASAATVTPEWLADMERTTLAECVEEFRAAWSAAAPDVFISANPAFRITREEIAQTLNQSRETEVSARANAPAPPAFAYTDFGTPGRLVRDEFVEDLDLRLTEFANGVRCNFKATPFEADTVTLNVRVGAGKLGQPADQPGLDLLANGMVLAGGLGRHTVQELGHLLTVNTVRPAFYVETDASVFAVRCSRRDLLAAMQLVAAFLTDAAYRPDALRGAQSSFSTMYQGLLASPGGPVAVVAGRELAAGDRRFGTPMMDELSARTVEEMKAWLEPEFRRGAIEMSVVGDVTWEETLAAVARTLGALPPRAARAATRMETGLRPPKPPAAPKVLGIDPKLKQCAITWFWPVPEMADIAEERRYTLLAAVFADRLRVKLRDALGATYTPTAAFSFTKGFPSMNTLSCYAEIDPPKLDRAMEIIQREAMSLALRGPEKEEFARIKPTYVRGMTDNLRTNAYWGRTVLFDAQEYPSRLEAARNRAADIAAITEAELVPLAKRLDPSAAYKYITVPVPPALPTTTKPPLIITQPATKKGAGK